MSNHTSFTSANVLLTRRDFTRLAIGALGLTALSGCSSADASAPGTAAATAAATYPITKASDGTYVLKAIADATPHAEILAYAAPALAADGITVDLVSTAPDDTLNQRTEDGEIDFNYDQHVPYLNEWNQKNAGDLVSAGNIHVEPITAYSDTYATTADVPDDAKVAIPNNATNEYRALKILEDNGFIVLSDASKDSLSASKEDITTYVRPVEIVELDAAQIIPTRESFDLYITNTNRYIESGITANKLFSESADSPYANVVVVRPENKDNEAITKLVEVLRSDDVKGFIEQKYNGAVVPSA
ncbi:MAG: MetQ/NlpA family ABC transporter substrate-binding protein [Atopobiaceae bacterium]|jgi:D-methionine transport system substrate-binding protein|nr:MetQ/NlpA family ABC transporter substrate-binding protein [Atopobiaceae bacterium]MCH4180309.1 MetQ/NlpA family ABC transporter substrate-binding protein [Atopobiaceae bacterium]MCH4214881.1 MetQ/NlpA family ABC transporter substrate-binding protein [Atopobiaceae bacterium]MCH4229318.1 MetQ/NlpA family ABC transporter substrate-binding protein [Atopobiaceae bacterium]MCH4276373.1 MetQ/NlpA family ABC transporter substrate-binding protein [Atopobiaceae bacterium]